MNHHRWRDLAGVNSLSSPTKATPPPATDSSKSTDDNVDSDFVVILAALLCALICVLGLVAIARCGWIRWISDRLRGRTSPLLPPANKGLRKKILRSLPKLTYSDEESSRFSDCPICLSEFVAGDEIRVLPQCSHGFHVVCIDTWLGSHSSCPSCRKILVAAGRCQKCGELPASSVTGAESHVRETRVPGDSFLP